MRPLLKYCGNHHLEDVVVTANSKANYLGFVFAPSKRYVTPQEVKRWLSKVTVPQKIVGVFVNATLQEIEKVLREVPLDIIQCHGEETPERIRLLKTKFNREIWKVIHHHNSGLEGMETYRGLVDGYVIDSKVGNVRGGTGVTFDWTAIPSYQQEAIFQNVPLFIAGGVNVHTINQLLQYNPAGIDLSSGIEEENGRKSKTVVKQFEERLYI